MLGRLDLNSIQSCTDSLQQRLKQTMLNQELVFMSQVYELHQLYRTQTAMMEDFKWKGLDAYNFHKGGMKSSNQNTLAKLSMAESTRFENFNSHREQLMRPGFTQKPLDLQLSADEFISQSVDNFSDKEPLRCSLIEPVESKIYNHGALGSGLDNLNLSLSIGRDGHTNVGDRKHGMVNKTFASSSDIIDLEDPNFSFSNVSSRGKHKLEFFSQSGMRDANLGARMCRSPLEAASSCWRQISSYSGLNGQDREFSHTDILSKNQASSSCKTNILDLNMVQLDDSSFFSNNFSTVLNSRDKVSTDCTMASSVHPRNKLDTHQHLDLNSNFALSYREKNRVEWMKDDKFRVDKGKISFIDLDSDSSEELCNRNSDPKIESVDSSLKPSKGFGFDLNLVDAAEANIQSETQTVMKQKRSSSSSESDCVIDPQSCSLKTMQSAVKPGDLNFSSSDESQKADHSGEPDQKSSDSIESKADDTVQTAAESLVLISLETRVSIQGDREDQPQRSLESYEAIVLREKETEPDDYCVSSTAFIVDELDKKDSPYKLKRGTRMKDFQKDVLPGLSVLSRHEIREDINIMEGVIRSREYKRMRAKFGDVGDWFRPARNKRSRVSSSRRHYA